MSDVFISYSRKDQEFVHKLNDALKLKARESWVDWEQIRIAEDWWRKIQEAIAATDTFIFVITTDSLASDICRDEVDYASSLNKRIVPILRVAVSKEQVATMHHALATHNWLYFQETNDFDKVFEDLLEAIDTDPVHTKEHTRLLVRAIEWDSEQKDDFLLRGSVLDEAEQWLAEVGEKKPLPTKLQVTFIENSRKVENANLQAIQILKDAKLQASRQVKFGSAVLTGTLLLALAGGVWASRFALDEKLKADGAKTEAEQSKQQAKESERIALERTKESEQTAKDAEVKTKKADAERKKANDEKEKANTDVVKAKEELSKQEAEAKAKILEAEEQLKNAETGTKEAEEKRQKAEKQIALAKVKLRSIDAKFNFLDNRGIESLLIALDAGYKLKQIADESTDWQEIRQDVLPNLQIGVYRVPEQNRLKGHTATVNSANFSPDGSKIVTASDDKTARVWDVKGNLIADLKGHTDTVNSANFSPDGSKIVTASSDSTARVWNSVETDFDRLLSLGCQKLQDYLTTNPNATNGDRAMCGIEAKKKV